MLSMSTSTKIINFFGGPGVGKSTMAHYTTYLLKSNNIECEYVGEVAKEFVWEDDIDALSNQFLISGKTIEQLDRLLGKVEYVVTDGPLFLQAVYAYKRRYSSGFINDIIKAFNKYDNINFLLPRKYDYQTAGRVEKESEATFIDIELVHLFNIFYLPYTILPSLITLEDIIDRK